MLFLLFVALFSSSLFAKTPLHHTVKKGETLSYIAHKYHIKLAKLQKLNSLSRNSKLLVGKKLKLTSTKKQKRVTATIALNRKNRYPAAPISRLRKAYKVVMLAKSKLGRRYVWGATGSRTFDCSGLTSYVYRKIGVNIPRTSRNQARYGRYIRRNQLRPGDLVFFDTNFRRRGVDHVGIYLGGGKFIHASSAKRKVIITSINKPFYAQRFRGGRRVLISG